MGEIIKGGLVSPGTFRNVFSRTLGSPALGTATAVLAATAAASPSVVTTGITNPDVARCITATPGGTTGNVLAVSVIVTGTDIAGAPLTETLPAFTAGASTAVTSLNAFATVTSISLPATGTAVTISVGTSSKVGLTRTFSRDTVLNAYLNGVREATRPTVAFNSTVTAKNFVTLSSALAGTPVIVDFYES